jgi:chromosome segregation ATPase
MLSVLKCDDKLETVMRSVFAKSMICRSMAHSTRIAKENRLDCVTLEGMHERVFCNFANDIYFKVMLSHHVVQ